MLENITILKASTMTNIQRRKSQVQTGTTKDSFSGHFFEFSIIFFFGFVELVAIFDIVHDVEAIYPFLNC